MVNHNHKTEKTFDRVLELIECGVPVSKIQDEFAPDERADVMGAIAAAQALIAERESITPPLELLSQIIKNITIVDTPAGRTSPWVRFVRILFDTNPIVKVGVPVMAFAVILLAIISSRMGMVSGEPAIVAYDKEVLQVSGGNTPASWVSGDMAKNIVSPPAITPQPAGVSARSAVDLVIEAALADAAADKVIATNDMANTGLIANDSAAINDLGQFFNPNAF